MNSIRIVCASVVLAIISIFSIGVVASAQSATIDKTVVKKGQNYSITETINGDLYCFGQEVELSGKVNGDVFCAAQKLIVSGDINGSARLAAETIEISGQISGNVSTAASSLSIQPNAVLGQDIQSAAQDIVVDGTITRDFSAIAKTVKINGNIGRDISVKNANLTVADTAIVGGNVYNNSSKSPNINKDAILGKINSYNTTKSKFASAAKNFFVGYAFWFISLMIISFAVLWLFPRPLVNSVNLANTKPVRVLATGLIVVFISPLLMLFVALTIVGIPLALLLGLIYIITLAMSGPFFAFLVGSKFLPERKLWVRMLLGSTLVLVSYSLPLIGFFVAIVVGVFGSGMFASIILERLPQAKHPKTQKSKPIE